MNPVNPPLLSSLFHHRQSYLPSSPIPICRTGATESVKSGISYTTDGESIQINVAMLPEVLETHKLVKPNALSLTGQALDSGGLFRCG